MAMSKTALALVKKRHLNSVEFIPPLKTNLSPSQQKRAMRILSPTLPPGFHASWKVRRYGNNLGVPNWCPRCGKTVRQIAEEDGREVRKGWLKTYLAMHLERAH